VEKNPGSDHLIVDELHPIGVGKEDESFSISWDLESRRLSNVAILERGIRTPRCGYMMYKDLTTPLMFKMVPVGVPSC
jgi:hypothetical protein